MSSPNSIETSLNPCNNDNDKAARVSLDPTDQENEQPNSTEVIVVPSDDLPGFEPETFVTDIGQDEELTLKINDVESFSTLEPYTGGDQKSLVALLKSRNSSPDSCGLFLESHLLLGQMSLDVLTGYGLRDSSSDITQQLPLDAAALKRFSMSMIRVIEQATGATVTLDGDMLTIVQDPQLLRETLLLVDNLKVGGNRVPFLRVMIEIIQGFQGRTQENKFQLQAYVTSCVLIELQNKLPLGGLFGLNLHRKSLRHLKIVYESISPLANVLNRISQGSVFTMLGDVDEDYNRGDNVESNPEDRTKRRKFLHTDAPDPYSGKTAHGGACASLLEPCDCTALSCGIKLISNLSCNKKLMLSVAKPLKPDTNVGLLIDCNEGTKPFA